MYTVQQHAAESGAFKINLANFKEGNTGTHGLICSLQHLKQSNAVSKQQELKRRVASSQLQLKVTKNISSHLPSLGQSFNFHSKAKFTPSDHCISGKSVKWINP